MYSRVRNHFQGVKFARMSSGTYCIIRDLGLVKGGKGMRHHEVLVTFSLKVVWRAIRLIGGDRVNSAKRRMAWLQRVREGLRPNVRSSAMTENSSPR